MEKSLAAVLFLFVSYAPVCAPDRKSPAGTDLKPAEEAGMASSLPARLQAQTQPVPPSTSTPGSARNSRRLDLTAIESPTFVVKDGAVYLSFGHLLNGLSIPMVGGGASGCIPGSKASWNPPQVFGAVSESKETRD